MPVPVPGRARRGEEVREEEAGNRGEQQIVLIR